MPDIIHDTPADSDSDAPATGEQLARQQAIKRIERRHRFWISAAVSAVGMILLVAIWATSEYHNAGGWPTSGFSQSSGIHDVWNYWIVYPLVGWVLILAAGGWSVYGHKPISESEIKREIERQAGRPR
jgi:2TM domain